MQRERIEPMPRVVVLDERTAWVMVVALTIALERYLKHTGQPMLSHAVWRNPWARAVVLVFAVHLLDNERHLERIDPVTLVGRSL
jgi:hypothetical protein